MNLRHRHIVRRLIAALSGAAPGLICAMACKAQQEQGTIVIGATAGYERGSIGGVFAARRGEPDCGRFDEGIVTGRRFGLRADLAGWSAGALGLSLRADVALSRRSLTASDVQPLVYVIPGVGDAVVDRSFTYDVSAVRSTLGLLATMPIAGPVTIGIGPRVAFHISSSAVETERLDPDSGVTFEGEGSSGTVRNGEPYSAAPVSLDALGTVSLRLPAGRRIGLVVEISASLGLTSEMGGWSERRSMVGASLGILFDIAGSADGPDHPVAELLPAEVQRPEALAEPRSAAVELTPPRRTALGAAIRLYGVGPDGQPRSEARVVVHEDIYRTELRFLPRLSFAPGSDALPDDCRKPLPGEPEGMRERAIVHDGSGCRLLDLIGMRMRRSPGTELTLRSSSADPRHAAARCDSVREHLVRQWGIAAARIRCEGSARKGATEEIELAGDPALLAPVMLLDTGRTFGTPRVKLEPSYQTDAGLKRWEIRLTHLGVTLAHYVHQGGETKEVRELVSHTAPDPVELAAAPLVASFIVEDSAGEHAEASGTISVHPVGVTSVIARRIDERSGTDETMTTIPAGADQEAEERIVDAVAGMVRTGDRVTVLWPREARRSPGELSPQERPERIAARLARALKRSGLAQEIARRSVPDDGIEGESGAVGIRLEREIR